MYDYQSSTPFIANTDKYPTAAERSRFLEAYVAHGRKVDGGKEEVIATLEREIRDWRVAVHAFWCAWAVVMSEDDPEVVLSNGREMENQIAQDERETDEDKGVTTTDFDYTAYADQKMRLFLGELASGRMYDDYKDGIEGSKLISD
jgi:thiamine kinase-like enzyme